MGGWFSSERLVSAVGNWTRIYWGGGTVAFFGQPVSIWRYGPLKGGSPVEFVGLEEIFCLWDNFFCSSVGRPVTQDEEEIIEKETWTVRNTTVPDIIWIKLPQKTCADTAMFVLDAETKIANKTVLSFRWCCVHKEIGIRNLQRIREKSNPSFLPMNEGTGAW